MFFSCLNLEKLLIIEFNLTSTNPLFLTPITWLLYWKVNQFYQKLEQMEIQNIAR